MVILLASASQPSARGRRRQSRSQHWRASTRSRGTMPWPARATPNLVQTSLSGAASAVPGGTAPSSPWMDCSAAWHRCPPAIYGQLRTQKTPCRLAIPPIRGTGRR